MMPAIINTPKNNSSLAIQKATSCQPIASYNLLFNSARLKRIISGRDLRHDLSLDPFLAPYLGLDPCPDRQRPNPS